MGQVNQADGLGVAEIKKLGIEQVIISTEQTPVVFDRAHKLGIPCLQGINKKKEASLTFCKKIFDLKDVAYVGNDINDKKAMETVGISFCPADAHESIKIISDRI
jgi:3-deoxy-D-manno-octulosonate 8-phosphate phosphatase (KDO 8-P phosphatase)